VALLKLDFTAAYVTNIVPHTFHRLKASRRQSKALMYTVIALTALLCVSLASIGGIVYAVVQLTKEITLKQPSTATPTAFTPGTYMMTAAGSPVKVQATTALKLGPGVSVNTSDAYLESLQSLTMGPVTIRVAGWARTEVGLFIFSMGNSPMIFVNNQNNISWIKDTSAAIEFILTGDASNANIGASNNNSNATNKKRNLGPAGSDLPDNSDDITGLGFFNDWKPPPFPFDTIGINTVGNSHRNANFQIRAEPIIPRATLLDYGQFLDDPFQYQRPVLI
jgi:hypothetical protein